MSPARADLVLFHIPSFARSPCPLKLRHGFVDGQEISLALFLRQRDNVSTPSVIALCVIDLVMV